MAEVMVGEGAAVVEMEAVGVVEAAQGEGVEGVVMVAVEVEPVVEAATEGPAPVAEPAMSAPALVVVLMEQARALTAPGPALAELTAMVELMARVLIAALVLPRLLLRLMRLRLRRLMQLQLPRMLLPRMLLLRWQLMMPLLLMLRRPLRPMMPRRRHQWLLLPL
jgi:hypothetical protein